jgi:cysteine desulfurase
MQIYLDYSATTPPRRDAIRVIENVLRQQWGNPSSLHEWGQRAATVMEVARMQVACLIKAQPESIIFTGGGTEANNLAILGIARRYRAPQHLIISSVEHPAIASPVQLLQEQGWEVTRLSVDRRGGVDPLELERALRDNTVLVSIIYGQSEVGTLQPIKILGEITRSHGALFHTDAVQVAGRVSINVQELPIDLLSLSSHKIYGPQGVGALYVRPGVELFPLILGGGQELNLRSGTQAIPILAGFGVAAELAEEEMSVEMPRLSKLRDRVFDLLSDVPSLLPTGDRINRLPHHVSFCLVSRDRAITGKTLVREMNLAGIGISSGSACSSGKLSPSKTLLAMGYSEKEGLGAIRLTLGRETTAEDIEWSAMVLKQILGRIFAKSFALTG